MKTIVLCTILSLISALPSFGGDNPKSVRAVRTATPPRIDGALDDAVWQSAEAANNFTQRDPDDGKPATERSDVRVLYDDEALYFSCMFYDSDPAGIVSRLTRRDNEIESDRASIRIDSYHDHQTGYEFTFNVAGVKVDILQYNDAALEDESWDPVWEVETRRTPEGWSAEVKIPFHILRYRTLEGSAEAHEWGINFIRYISRKQESDWWAHTPKSQSGFVSRFGHLTGLDALPSPRHIELLPFIVGKERYEPAQARTRRSVDFLGNAGLDLKYGISSNFTIDATVNPDFGQVEADPAVLNLSTFETFYPEKRPFFIEGTQIIRFSTFGGDFGPGMFYSRRIGRAISPSEIPVPTGGIIEEYPQTTTILGAAKVSGKTNGGLSIGMLQAVTQEERATVRDPSGAPADLLLERPGYYSLLRLKQDILSNSNIGVIFTSVARESRAPAFTNGWDWDLKLMNNAYSLSGFLALSHTTNAARERISGSAGKIQYGKIAGEHWLWSVSSDFTSKGYNINDMGFFFRPNDYGFIPSITYKEDTPAQVVRNYDVSVMLHERRNFDEINLGREARMNGRLLFTNYWRMTASANADHGEYEDRETRGNGLYGKPHRYGTSTYLFSDARNDVVFKLGQRFQWDAKNMRQTATEAGVEMKPLSWVEVSLDGEYIGTRNQEAWMENLGGDAIFGDRTTDQYNMTLRSTVTFRRELTLQVYGQVFLAKGSYANYRKLIGTSGFTPYPSSPALEAEDFNRTSFNTNVVLRWEYLPGSTLFLVWSQARQGEHGEPATSFANDFDGTFRVAPSNVVLLKASYWWTL